MTELPTLAEIADVIRARRVSPVELTRRCLERIDPALNAFITVTADAALEQAAAAETEIARGGHRGPLHGVPIALKDLIDTAGVRTTGASALFADRVPAEDAEVVRRLRAAGAVLLGKLNLHELAYGGGGVIGHFGATRNPRSPGHITGGSSSGSAAAVAAGMCFAALGTDTAGSIRLPAALCGIVGFKPSYGLVSVRGVLPLSWSYDHVGPMTRSVRDAALVLQVIAGPDPADPFSRELPPADYVAALDADGPQPRVGVPRAHFFADLDPEVAAIIERALAEVAAVGDGLIECVLPVDADRTVFIAEAYAYHRRWVEASPALYQPETLRRFRTGATVTAPEYIEHAHRLLALRRQATAFAGVDLVVTPTAPLLAPSLAELEARPETLRPRELVLLRNTRPFNVLGVPALTIPCGASRAGLAVGLQIAGPYGADADVLRFGAALERRLARHSVTISGII